MSIDWTPSAKFLRSRGVAILLVLALVYFGYYGIHGGRGLLAWVDLNREVEAAKLQLAELKAERSEMPVMMPGSAIGRMMRSEIASRPKNLVRASAAAASVPSTIAMRVAISATWSESHSAAQTSGRSQATANHLSVSPGGGNW